VFLAKSHKLLRLKIAFLLHAHIKHKIVLNSVRGWESLLLFEEEPKIDNRSVVVPGVEKIVESLIHLWHLLS